MPGKFEIRADASPVVLAELDEADVMSKTSLEFIQDLKAMQIVPQSSEAKVYARVFNGEVYLSVQIEGRSAYYIRRKKC